MHVLLAGATGVLGRRIVPLLLAGGHRVTAITRGEARTGELARAGATPVVADVRDAERVSRLIARARPDVVMHQLTDLSDGSSLANAKLRSEGTRNLVAAARAAGVTRFVAQSIAWAYQPGGVPATESTPLDLEAGERSRRITVDGVADLERHTRQMPSWVVLRYGMLYGPRTWFWRDGARAEQAVAGALPGTDDVTSFLHVDDAASAAVLALDWPSGAVNVCDDEPAPARDWVPAFCAAVGADAPGPASGAGIRTGWARGADNHHARTQLGWVPGWPSWRTGFAAMSAIGRDRTAR